MSNSDIPDVEEDTGEPSIEDPGIFDPICKPIGFAFSPIMDTAEAAVRNAVGQQVITDQTLIGLVSLAGKAVVDCPIKITSTDKTVILPQPTVTIPWGYTTARVYAIYRSTTPTPLTAININAENEYGRLTAKIVLPVDHLRAPGILAIDSRQVREISFPPQIRVGASATGHVKIDAPAPLNGTVVKLIVNDDDATSIQLPPGGIVTVPHNCDTADVPITILSVPPSEPLIVDARTLDHEDSVPSNPIMVYP